MIAKVFVRSVGIKRYFVSYEQVECASAYREMVSRVSKAF